MANNLSGKISQVLGAVVDVEFEWRFTINSKCIGS